MATLIGALLSIQLANVNGFEDAGVAELRQVGEHGPTMGQDALEILLEAIVDEATLIGAR